MTQLFTIQCRFQTHQHSTPVDGIAICSDPNTPITFIHPDGKPYLGKDIWTYNLRHHYPWSRHDIIDTSTFFDGR